MKNRLYILLSSIIVIILLLTGCTPNIYKVAYPALSDGKYDTEFPYINCSGELKEITRSVKKVICITYYKTYIFDTDTIMHDEPVTKELLKRADSTSYFYDTVGGSGTLIYYDNYKAALLTAAHTFNRPDTIVTYYRSEPNSRNRVIHTISIIKRQNNISPGMPGGGDLEVLLMDKKHDISILSMEYDAVPDKPLQPIKYPFGEARKLEWGSFVYVIGYPKGFQLITKGIVSNPNRDDKGSFLIDALFNRGLSGAIILAIKDGAPNFEIVGIANSAYSDDEAILVPEENWEYNENLPYKGPTYVKKKKYINYGMSIAISSEAIINLFKKNERFLSNRGYDFTKFYTVNK